MTGIALLGAGRMGMVHAKAVSAAGAKIVAVYDPLEANARAMAQFTGATVYSSAAEAMADKQADAIMIATSSDTHSALVIEASKTGKPILCEKPLAPSLAETKACIEQIGMQAAKKVFLGFNRRFDKGHASVRNAVHQGVVGTLEQLTITSRDPFPPPLEYIPRSGGLFRDMMIHDFDMARSIVGQELVEVTAHGSSIVDPAIGKLGDIDTASVTMRTESGVLVTILNSRRCAFGFDQRIEAFGALGMVVSDNPLQSGFKRYLGGTIGAGAPILEFFLERYGESYSAEIRTFLECAFKGEDMPVNAIDGLRAATLAEAATQSLKTGATVRVNNIA